MKDKNDSLTELEKIIDYKKASASRPLSRRLKEIIYEHQLGQVLDIVDFILSAILVIQYIGSTYDEGAFKGSFWAIVNFVCHIYFF